MPAHPHTLKHLLWPRPIPHAQGNVGAARVELGDYESLPFLPEPPTLQSTYIFLRKSRDQDTKKGASSHGMNEIAKVEGTWPPPTTPLLPRALTSYPGPQAFSWLSPQSPGAPTSASTLPFLLPMAQLPGEAPQGSRLLPGWQAGSDLSGGPPGWAARWG